MLEWAKLVYVVAVVLLLNAGSSPGYIYENVNGMISMLISAAAVAVCCGSVIRKEIKKRQMA